MQKREQRHLQVAVVVDEDVNEVFCFPLRTKRVPHLGDTLHHLEVAVVVYEEVHQQLRVRRKLGQRLQRAAQLRRLHPGAERNAWSARALCSLCLLIWPMRRLHPRRSHRQPYPTSYTHQHCTWYVL